MKKIYFFLVILFLVNPIVTKSEGTTDEINLVKNQQWKIEITEKINKNSTSQYSYIITRNGDNLSAKEYRKDLSTGKKSESTHRRSSIEFRKKDYLSKKIFLVYEDWYYEYPSIYEGRNSTEMFIPTTINKKSVRIESRHEHWLRDSFSLNEEYNLKILEKEENEIECRIKGEHYQGEYIYYTDNSSKFNNLSKFVCFENELTAQENGYNKNYLETQEKIKVIVNDNIFSWKELRFKKIGDFKVFAKKTRSGKTLLIWKPKLEKRTSIYIKQDGIEQKPVFQKGNIALLWTTEGLEYHITIKNADKIADFYAK